MRHSDQTRWVINARSACRRSPVGGVVSGAAGHAVPLVSGRQRAVKQGVTARLSLRRGRIPLCLSNNGVRGGVTASGTPYPEQPGSTSP